jgi:mono/diheme cytochrome c family protein
MNKELLRTMNSFQRITAGGTLFLLGAFSAWAQQDAKDIYLDKCAVCHGADGAAKTAKGKKLKMKDVHETAVKMKVDEMIKIVLDGKAPDMDAYGKQFSAALIKALVDYYRGLAK